MPLPSPKKGEKSTDFLSRCMGNAQAVKDFPQSAQRFAVCSSRLRRVRGESAAPRQRSSIPTEEIQSLIFAKTWFQTKEDVEMFLQSHGYTNVMMKETEQSFIYTQSPENHFIPKSFETMEFQNGVAVVVGTKELTIRKNFDPNKPFSEATLGEYDSVLHKVSKSEPIEKRDLVEYFECKYSQLVKVVDGVAPYRSNLFRFAMNGILPEVGFKGLTNYDSYDYEDRLPVEYVSFSTGEEEVEGIYEGTYFLEIDGEKLVLKVDPGMAGSISLKYFSIQKDTIAKFQNQIKTYISENNFLKGKKLFANGSFIKLPKVGWDDIVISDELRQSIQKNVVNYITRIPELKAKGLPVKRGLLLHGSPGNGKTLLGKVLANVTDCTFIWVPYTASAEGMSYKDVFEMARELSPSIVLMEDLASQGGMDRRSEYNHTASYELGVLLNLLEGVEENEGVVTIATENYVNNLDIALRNRPGRFDIILHMPNPEYEQREAILSKLLPEYPGSRIQSLANKSKGMSCAHLKELSVRLMLEDEPVDRDSNIIDDMVKTFGIDTGDPIKVVEVEENY